MIKSFARKVAQKSRYRKPVRWLVNHGPVATQMDAGDGVTFGRDVLLRGHIRLSDGATIDRGCSLLDDVDVGQGAHLFEEVTIHGTVDIGRRTTLNPRTDVVGDVSIGKFCAIARDTTFQGYDHDMNQPAVQDRFYSELLETRPNSVSKGGISVGNDVWMGKWATILAGNSIGHGSVVGAGAVVTDDVEPYSIVGGVPAERIGWRFDQQTREQLLDIEWWDWSDERLRANREFFTTDLTDVDDIRGLIRTPE